MSNLATVQSIYAAFGRGDVPAILAPLADDVEWEYGVAPNDIPWLQPRRGPAGVVEFLRSVQGLELRTFTPKTFLEGPGIVVVLVDIDARVKRTGQRIAENEEVHIWRFNAAGRVIRFRHAVDSYQHSRALQTSFTGDERGEPAPMS